MRSVPAPRSRAVVSSGDVGQAKPDPGIVEKALDESGIDPGRAVMVGDTVWDVLAAERAGIRCIGLLCGGIAAAELRGAGAAQVYERPRRAARRPPGQPDRAARARLGSARAHGRKLFRRPRHAGCWTICPAGSRYAASGGPVNGRIIEAARADGLPEEVPRCLPRDPVDPAGAKVHDVLLVEDDPGSVLITREAFEVSQAPGTLHVVGDGELAMEFLHQAPGFTGAPRPSLILLDINLPRRNGPGGTGRGKGQ